MAYYEVECDPKSLALVTKSKDERELKLKGLESDSVFCKTVSKGYILVICQKLAVPFTGFAFFPLIFCVVHLFIHSFVFIDSFVHPLPSFSTVVIFILYSSLLSSILSSCLVFFLFSLKSFLYSLHCLL